MWINVRRMSISMLRREIYRIRFKDRYSAQKENEEVFKAKSDIATQVDSINFIKRKSNKQS